MPGIFPRPVSSSRPSPRPVPDPESSVVRDLRGRLRAARRRITAGAVLRGALVTLAVVGAAVAVALGVEAALWMGVGLRTLLAAVLGALVLGLVGGLVGVPVLRGMGVLPGLAERDVVRRAGEDFSGVDRRLTALLDLADGRTSSGNGRLREAALAGLAAEVQDVPFERVRAWGPARRALPYAAFAAVALAVLFVAAPGTMSGAAFRLMEPGRAFAPPAPFALRVAPGDVEVARGTDLAVRVAAVGEVQPLAATLEVGREGERAVEEIRLRSDGAGRFSHTVEAVRASVRYRVVADGVASEWFTARVVARPVVRGVRVTVVPPAYAGRPPVVLPEGVGDASGLAGSAVRVQIGLGGERAVKGWLDVRWASGARERVALRIGGDPSAGSGQAGALGRLVLRGAGTYRVRLQSAAGVTNADPAVYSLGVFADTPPQITLLHGADGDLAGAVRPVRFRISDDAGFAGGSLVWRVAAGPGRRAGAVRRVALPVRRRPLEQTVDLMWRMAGVRPGDTVEFYGEVREAGPGKRGRTPLVRLRFASTEERVETFETRRDSAATTLERMRRQARQQGSRAERLRDELRARPEADWEARRQVEQLRQDQAAMQSQARQLQQQMREMAEQLRGSDLVDPDLQRRFEQMERVMEDLQSPELQEALQRLQEAMEQLDLQQMLQQADRVEEEQATFEERLERARALLERLEAAVEMEEAARQAESLAEREERLARDSERLQERQDGESQEGDQEDGEQRGGEQRPARSPEAERRRMEAEQRDAAEDAAALDEQLRELQEQLENIPNAPDEAVEEMREETTPDGGLPEQMEQNAEQIRQNQMQPAQQGQQQMARQLRRMAQQMRQQSQAMQGQQARVDGAAIRRALEDVLTLSRNQEALATQAAATPDGNPATAPLARRQRDLRDGLRTVADTLRRVARSVPQLTAAVQTRAGNGGREMDLALARLADRDAAQASSHGRTAMAHLNELALLLSDALEQQQQQSGSGQGSPQQQMQQMGEQQQRLNQQIQEMLGRTAGQRLSPGEGQRLRQMAERQEALRRGLQEMIQQQGGALGPGAQSALQRLQEEMGRAAAELRRGRLTDAVVPRQQLIHERMLQAERSVNERGQEERREAQTGSPRPAPAPPPLPPPDRPADRVRADLLRLLESGYSPDVQDLIRRYFERLQGRYDG
jgi:hypothetical protein